jgi:signal transduction histidine kinase
MLRGLTGNLRKRPSSNPGTGLRLSFWPTALIGIVVIKAVLAVGVTPGSFALSYSGVSYLLLLLLACGIAIRNAIRDAAGTRPFWMILAAAYGFWALDQSLTLYYELGRHIEAPDTSIADPALFLHIVLMMAAAATFPHLHTPGRKLYRTILNPLFLLFFWIFLYGYLVFPYQYFSNATSYGSHFDVLYLLANLALLLILGVLTVRTRGSWKPIYRHLLGASALYAISSTAANLATDSGGYINGKLYGLGLTASVCWFVWIPLRAQRIEGEAGAARSDGAQSSRSSAWEMILVLMVPVPIIWELFQRDENVGLPTLRLLVAIIAILGLATAAYIKQYLARREMNSDFELANDRLRLAMEAGSSVGWDLDVKSGRNVWFGDLGVFGIDSETRVTAAADFYRLVHPDDRTRVSEAMADARQHRKLYAEEFRVLQPDGSVRWLGARGKFYYAENGEAVRMLGVSLDITKRKLAEEAVSLMNRRVIEAEERERERVAKDLHENIGQRLALLAIAVEQLKNDFPDEAAEFHDPMDSVWKRTLGILTDVKASAHELYSPRLEYLGIAEVMKTFCEEFAERKGVEIDFRSQGATGPVLPDVSICLFRVLQEALHNGVMHSGVKRFRVQLWTESNAIHLRVSDSGVGFDLGAARGGRGLGLVRIEQRIKLVEGTSWIDSQPQKGTTVEVSVPMHSGREPMRAAG